MPGHAVLDAVRTGVVDPAGASTGCGPRFFTSTAKYWRAAKSQCPPGAFSVMPGQGCLCPVAI